MLFAAAATFVIAALQAGEPAVRGTVWDESTGEPVAGARVSIPALGRIARTDSAGHYELRELRAGEHAILVARIGYHERALRILLGDDEGVRVDVSLLPSPEELPPVVTAGALAPPASPGSRHSSGTPAGTRSITDLALRSHPQLAEPDFLAALGGVADAAIVPESPVAPRVRGGTSDQTTVLVDGMPLFVPVHAAGSLGSVSPDAIDEAALHAGVMPARLGDALSGVVEMRTREPGAEHVQTRGALSMTTAGLAVDGPLARGGTRFLVAVRHAAPLLFSRGARRGWLDAASRDAIGRIVTRAAGGELDLLAVAVTDRAGFDAVAASDDSAEATAERHAFGWSGRSAQLRWRGAVDGRSALTLRLWHADQDTRIDWWSDGDPLAAASVRSADAVDATLDAPREGGAWRGGLSVVRQRTAYEARSRERSAMGAADASPSSPLALDGRVTVLTVHAEHERRLGPRAELTAGARVLAIGGVGFAGEPRVALRLSAGRASSVTVGVARTHQLVQSLANPESPFRGVAGVELPAIAGGRVPLAAASQLTVAASMRPVDGLEITLDAYARRLRGLVLVAPAESRPFAVDSFATGSGRVVGAVLGFEATRGPVLTTGSLGSIRASYIGETGQPNTSRTASRWVDAGVVVRQSERTAWRAAVVAHDGRSAMAFQGPFEWESCNVIDGGCELSGAPDRATDSRAVRLPAYVRVDLGVRRSWRVRLLGTPATLDTHLTVGNVLDRRNAWAVITDETGLRRTTAAMRPASVVSAGISWR